MKTSSTISLAMFVAVACAWSAVAQIEPTSKREEELRLARSYIQAGRHHEASKIAQGLLQADANDADAKALLDESERSLRALHQQRIDMARAAASRAEATDADRLALAEAYYDAGDYGTAASLYRAIPSTGTTSESRLRLARSLAWTGQYDDAERTYREILAIQRTPEVETEYGRLLSWMGASAASVEALKRVYSTAPSEQVVVALANAQAWNGDRSAAIALLTDYTASHDGMVEAERLLRQMQSSPELRLERIDEAIDAEPYNLALRVERARLSYEAGRYASSLNDIEFVRKHSREEIAGLDELERTASTRRREEIARLDERRRLLATSQPAQTMISSAGNEERLSLAKAYTGHAAYDQAAELYEEHLRNHPDDGASRLEYARVLSWDRRYPQAQRQYEMLLHAQPDRADLQYEYAQALAYDRDYVPAVRTFRRLTDLSSNPRGHLYPDVPAKAHFRLGQIYRWYGWNESAVQEQNRALALDSDYVDARTELARSRMARPASSYGLTAGHFEDSNDLIFNRVDLDGQHWINQRAAIDGSIGRHTFEQSEESIAATSLSVGGRYRMQDRLMARGRVGTNLYDEGLGTRIFYGLGADWLPNLQTRAAFDYNHYDLVYDVFTLASLGADATDVGPALSDPIDIDDFRARIDYQTGSFLAFLADGSYGLISDDNRRQALHGLVSLRVLRSPFVAVKADGRYLSYDFRSDRYWSPTDYRSLAGVLAVGSDIADRFYWTVEGKIGRAYERSRSSDIRTYNATVTVPVSDVFDVVGSYSYGKSGRFENLIGGSGDDFTNYWQRRWYVGVRLRRLFADDDRRSADRYYYDNRALTGSPVIPPVGEIR